MASRFNECVAMDLKQFGKLYLLHIIDHCTRLSAGAIIRNKTPETIVHKIFQHWISIYGPPERILTDNGGEFCNAAVVELAEKFNLNLKTTAAESPWSNGLVERHNLVMGDMINKTRDDTGCDIEMATMWAVAAHNSLFNVHGFSPFQLVYGKNPSIPALQSAKPPALGEESSSEMVRKNLNALHAARQLHIRNESSDKIRRALSHNVRTSGEIQYVTGDKVYYKRLDSKKWWGPAVVLGQDGQQVLVKHQATYRRVHPCRLSLVSDTIVGLGDNSRTKSNSDSNTGNRHCPPAFEIVDEDKVHSNENPRVVPEQSLRPNENLPIHNEVPKNNDQELGRRNEDIENFNEVQENININRENEQANSDDEGTDDNRFVSENEDQELPRVNLESLKTGMTVRYKVNPDDSWVTTTLDNRGGKKGGAHGFSWNTTTTEGDKICISFDKVADWDIVAYSELFEDLEDCPIKINFSSTYVYQVNEEKNNCYVKGTRILEKE